MIHGPYQFSFTEVVFTIILVRHRGKSQQVIYLTGKKRRIKTTAVELNCNNECGTNFALALSTVITLTYSSSTTFPLRARNMTITWTAAREVWVSKRTLITTLTLVVANTWALTCKWVTLLACRSNCTALTRLQNQNKTQGDKCRWLFDNFERWN